VGSKGKILVLSEDGGKHKLLPEKAFADFVPPEPTIPKSPGHHEEWIRACKGEGTPGSNFGYAVGLTEIVLLGSVAYRAGRKIEWDGARIEGDELPGSRRVPEARVSEGVDALAANHVLREEVGLPTLSSLQGEG
jgi:hypothetical protein